MALDLARPPPRSRPPPRDLDLLAPDRALAAMSGPALKLEPADLRVLLQVYRYNAMSVRIGMPPGTPFLYAGKSHKRARRLCEAGLLLLHDVKLSPPQPTWLPVTITEAGIDAYNAAMAGKAPPQL